MSGFGIDGSTVCGQTCSCSWLSEALACHQLISTDQSRSSTHSTATDRWTDATRAPRHERREAHETFLGGRLQVRHWVFESYTDPRMASLHALHIFVAF